MSFHFRIVFWTVFAILLSTGAFYLIFADGKVQSWNDPKSLRRNNEENDPHEVEQSREMKENFVRNF